MYELCAQGHEVLAESGAGAGSGIFDDQYRTAGAIIVADVDELWARADMVLKAKEPISAEYHRFRRGLMLFSYLHFAAEPELTGALLDAGVTAIAYEAVQTADGRLPLLAPMSEVAGRLSVQAGAEALAAPAGGQGRPARRAPGVRALANHGAAVAVAADPALAAGLNVIEGQLVNRSVSEAHGPALQPMAGSRRRLTQQPDSSIPDPPQLSMTAHLSQNRRNLS